MEDNDYFFVVLSWIFMTLSVTFCWGFHIFVWRHGRTPEEKSLASFWRMLGIGSILGFSFIHLLIRRWRPGPLPALLKPILLPWIFAVIIYALLALLIRRSTKVSQRKAFIALDIVFVLANGIALLT